MCPRPQSVPAAEPNFFFSDTKILFWRRSCDQVLASLEVFSQKLLDEVKRFRQYGDKRGEDMICSSCITCLAHLAVLYEVVCRTDPDAREMYNLCDSALQRLGILASEIQLDEYTYFDLLLGVRPSSCRFPMVMAQAGDWDRTPGRNRYQSSTSA